MPNPIPGLSAAIDDARASDKPAEAGHNLPTPDVLAAEQYLAQVHADATLRDGMRDVDNALRGESGFLAARDKTRGMRPSLDALLVWEPTAKNAMEMAIVETHNTCGARVTPLYERELKDALSIAVHASTTDNATKARIGAGTSDKPEYRYVVVQAWKGDAAGNEPWRKDRTSANAELAKRKAQATGPASVEVWKWADEAAKDGGKVEGLRFLAAKVAAVGVGSSRWRSLLFFGIAMDALNAYVDSPHVKPIGQVWLPALGAAQTAHRKYMSDTRKAGAADKRNANDLNAAMVEAVNAVLDQHRTAKGRNVKEEATKLVDAFYRMVANVEKEFDVPGLWFDIRKLASVRDNVPLSTKENELAAKQAAEDAANANRIAAAAELVAQQEREREAAKLAKAQERQTKADREAKAKVDGDVSLPITAEPTLSKLLRKNKVAPAPAA